MKSPAFDNQEVGLTQFKEVDAVCERFEQAWQAGELPRIEDFLASASAPHVQAVMFKELLRLEHEYRRCAGNPAQPEEYRDRFPQYLELINPNLQPTVTGSGTQDLPPGTPVLQPFERLEEFEIKELLGRGAFGSVYRAWQHGADREVAIKVSVFRSDEARTMAHLDGHHHIARIYDQRDLPHRGLHIVYMEFVRGVTVRALISELSRLPTESRSRQTIAGLFARCGGDRIVTPDPSVRRAWIDQVCEIGAQIAEALAFAHQLGVLHYDVKPANIILDVNDNAKLVDFNVAQHSNIEQTLLGGTLAYMSPEQLDAYKEENVEVRKRKAAALDGRSDIYSLGIVLWEMITGRRPFADAASACDWTGSLTLMVSERWAGLSERNLADVPKCVPPGLREVLLRCLAPVPASRYAVADELCDELRLCLRTDVQKLLFPKAATCRALAFRWPALTLIAMQMPFAALCALSMFSMVFSYAFYGGFAGLFLIYLVPLIIPSTFLAAIAIGTTTARPVLWALRGLQTARCVVTDDVCERCLLLGHHFALLVCAICCVSAVLWGGFTLSRFGTHETDILFWSGSIFLCGMFAVALTFFAVTFVCVSSFLPRMMWDCRVPLRANLEPHLRVYFGVLLFCPFVAMILYVLATTSAASTSKLLMVWLALLGAAGICAGLAFARAIRANLNLIAEIPKRHQPLAACMARNRSRLGGTP